MAVFIGIDPGKHGALAVIGEDRRVETVVPFDIEAYRKVLLEIGCRHTETAVAAVEKVGAMPGQGVCSMFSFGENFGAIQGLLYALLISYQLVPPARWKKEFGVTSDKQTSIDACKRLFDYPIRRTDRCRKDDDGMAEALLLAEYARRHM